MSLKALVAKGEDMLKATKKQRNGAWGYEACSLSREILEDVLLIYPQPAYVKKTLIPLLQNLAKPISKMKLKPDDSFSNYTQGFVKNINWRISKLQRYAQGLPIVEQPETMLLASNPERE